MRGSDRFAIAIATSLLLASWTLAPLTADPSYLGPSWLLIIALNTAALCCRRTRWGSAAATTAQVVILAGFVSLISAAYPATAQLSLPHRLATLWSGATEHMRTETAPMSPNDGIRLLFIASIGVISILTDLLVVTLDKPALGLAPPLAVFLVPAISLGADTGLRPFLCIAVGYLGILIAESLNNHAAWTHGLSQDSAGATAAEQARAVVWRSAAVIAVPALAVAMIGSAALPTLSLSGWGFGEGSSNSNGPLRLSDPTLDLRRNLNRPADREVLTYRTSKPSGQYLRMASLPAFSKNGWQNAQTSISRGSHLSQPPGLTVPTGAERKTTIRIDNLDSEYLPLPYAPKSFNADGEWGYDPNSLVVISSDRGQDRTRATRELRYSVVSQDISPDPDALAGQLAGDPPDVDLTTAVPSDLPDDIRTLARRVTADAVTPADKAAAIQAYLRDSDNFTYSTDPRPGSGYRALENFLFRDKHGYCEQFAASMAVMARIVGIPSRVAVGFLPGSKSDGVWTVTSHDAHAWPELYFSGYGWVRFEPTPASVTGSAPSWSIEQSSVPDDEPSAQIQDTEPSAVSRPSAGVEQTTRTGPDNPAATQQSGQWLRTVAVGGGIAVLLALLSAPAAVRIRRRRRRLNGNQLDPGDQVEAAWAEVRDTVRDLHRTWPDGSPRTKSDLINATKSDLINATKSDLINGTKSDLINGTKSDQTSTGSDAAGQDALHRLALIVERERYGQTFADGDAATTASQLAATVRASMLDDCSRRVRLGCAILPRSVFRRGS